MALPNLVVSAVAEWNGKALAKGSAQIGKFDKTIKNLGRTLGVTFSAAALLGYTKKALQAYGEQIAEAKQLDTALRNIGYSYATAETEGYLDAIEKASGINRDILQPSFIALAQITKSTTIAQSMLNTAMDASAGTGLDLGSTTKILSQAYVGNYKGLQQLNLGLTKAELASKSYLEIEKLIAIQYAGQSKNAAESYQGGLERLKIAAEQASEEIGQSLVAALSISSGGMDKLIDKVDGAAGSISGLITNIAVLSKDLGDLFAGLPGAGVLDNIKGAIKGRLGALSIGRARDLVDKIKGRQGGFPQGVPQDIKNIQLNVEKAKLDKIALARQKELIALQKKALLAEKNKLSLSQAAETFDTNRISIKAALQATYDKDTRLRLEALMAIEDEEGDKALAKIKELNILTRATQTEKLNGLKGITETELLGLNTTLMTELAKIEATKAARIKAIEASGATQKAKDDAIAKAIADADTAQANAFAKYNDALAKQGGLNDLSFYSQKLQIQTLEVLRIASLEKTSAAQVVADAIALAAGVKTLEQIAAKRKELQDADNKAMAEAAAARKALEDKAFSDYYAALASQAAASLAADANLTATKLTGIATVSAAEASANAAAIAGVNALGAAFAGIAAANASAIAGVAALSAAIAAIPPIITDTTLPKPKVPGSVFADPDGTVPDLGGELYIDPKLVNPGAGNSYTISFNAGAIGSQDEFAALLQKTIQDLNRNGDPLTTAGTT